MRVRAYGIVLAMALAMGVGSVDAAPRRATVAIMPTQYFSADAQSALNITRSLAEQFRRQGYKVIDMRPARSAFDAMGLSMRRQYGDQVAAKFGRKLGVNLVAYPQLLALGTPTVAQEGPAGRVHTGVLLHVRVVRVANERRIYSQQVREDVAYAQPSGDPFSIPPPAATAVAAAATRTYFERVAGSRQEFGRRR